MSSTSSLIAEAAQAQPADAEALAALNQQVVSYAATIEQARANNRQGLPVGAQYLRNASARAPGRRDADPGQPGERQRRREPPTRWRPGSAISFVVRRPARSRRPWSPARSGWPAVPAHDQCRHAGQFGRPAAHRDRRSLVAVLQLRSAVNADLRTAASPAVNAAADARIEANNAKSNESLTLIARGSGQAFETAWKSSADSVAGNLRTPERQPELASQWQAYVDVHTQIRKLDDGGQWDKAVALATGSGTRFVQHHLRHLRQPISRAISTASAWTPPTRSRIEQPVWSSERSSSCLAGCGGRGARPLGRRRAAEGVPMRLQWRRPLLALAAVACSAAPCRPARLFTLRPDAAAVGAPASSAPTPSSPSAPAACRDNPLASYAPGGPLPTPETICRTDRRWPRSRSAVG